MPDRRALSTARLLLARAWARTGLLATAAVTVASAAATVSLVLVWLARSVEMAGDPPPPGVEPAVVQAQVETGAVALASAAPALVLLIAILAGTGVAQLARLIAAAREHETAAIRGRGFSSPQAWAADALEGMVVAVVGALVGVAVSAAVLVVLGTSPAAVPAQWPWILATTVILAVVFVVALRRGEKRSGSARGARATTAAAVVIVLLAAGLVVWQLPLARGSGFDPIVAIAPAVMLMTAALLALAVFGAGSAALAGPAARGRSLVPGYPARQVARRLQIYAVAVMLVALTSAQAVFASAYAGSWQAMTDDSAAVRAGADLRVDLEPQSASPSDVADAAAVTGVDAAAPALETPIEIGSTEAQLVSVPAEMIAPVVTPAGGLIDKEALIAAADPASGAVESDPVPLGAQATGIRVTATVDAQAGNPASLGLVAVVLDATGTPTAVQLDGAVETDAGTPAYAGEGALPAGTAPWRLLAIAAGLGPSIAGVDITVTLDTVEAVGAEPLDVAGSATLGAGGDLDAVVWLADGGVLAEADPAADADADAPPVEAVVTDALASRLGIGVGDPVEFRYAGTGRQGAATVSSVVEAVPGAATPLALFVPMETLLTSQLQRGTSIVPPNAVWATGELTADDELSAVLGDRPVTTAAPGVAADVVGALVGGWWIATIGSIALSLVAAFGIVQTLAIARRRELGVLRALGVTPARQARMRAGELGGVFAAALALGAGAGVLVAWLVVPALVRAVTPGILPLASGLTFSWLPLAIGLVALAAGLAVVVTASAIGTHRAARGATVGEESR
ncbi:hypothetical protein ASD56_03670 [Microbacterium sp. Root166]|uniref:FtsX-like permease family protein n=1 Tax=Microbacterium sp. Root166 TaxID=1736478 RepID=UPI0006F42FE0|nr:FtsX-like permease family protein [Microbacterium sp. Root166]KQZ85444.1 hypothetical protein ASD56_03670 [Microbacterium sp. Root166]